MHKDVQYLCLDNLIQKNIQSGEFKLNGYTVKGDYFLLNSIVLRKDKIP